MNYVRLLTIAGSDSGGGAGIQADLKTFAALGGYGMSVVTAITAQDTLGVKAIHEVPCEVVAAQIDAVLSDIGADAVKIGMLASSSIIHTVADRLRDHHVAPIVLDPVMVATSGEPLLTADALTTMKNELIPMVDLITPNIPESSRMLGVSVGSIADVREAAVALLDSGCRAVLIKGGHLPGEKCDDVLAVKTNRGVEVHVFEGQRVATNNTHGTGCTLSSAIATFLGRGFTLPDAVRAAKDYLTGALLAGASFALGHGHGPVCHAFNPIPVWKRNEN